MDQDEFAAESARIFNTTGAKSLNNNVTSGNNNKGNVPLPVNPSLIVGADDEDDNIDEHAILLTARDCEEESSTRKVSFVMTCILYFKSNFGAGLLGVPFAFRQAGVVAGIFGTILVSLIVTICTIFIVECQRHLREQGCKIMTLSDIGFNIWGKNARIAIDFVVLLCQLGSCTAYCIFIATSFTALIHPDAHDASQAFTTYSFLLLGLWPLLIGLSFIRKMNRMRFFSLAAEVIHFASCVAILISGFSRKTKCGDGTEKILCPLSLFRLETLPIFFGIVTFALEGIVTILPIERAMADPGQFRPMLILTMTLLTIVFVLFGALGYGAFGSETSGVIAVNVTGSMGVIIKICLCLVLLTSYAMQFIPVSDLVEVHASNASTDTTAKLAQLGRPLLVTVTTLIAWGFPHFGNILSIIGGVGFSSIGFCLPCLAYMRTLPEAITPAVRMFCVFCVSFGLFVAITAIIVNIQTA